MFSHNIKEVKNFKGYFVSDIGEVFTTLRNGKRGELTIMKLKIDKDGYLEVRN